MQKMLIMRPSNLLFFLLAAFLFISCGGSKEVIEYEPLFCGYDESKSNFVTSACKYEPGTTLKWTINDDSEQFSSKEQFAYVEAQFEKISKVCNINFKHSCSSFGADIKISFTDLNDRVTFENRNKLLGLAGFPPPCGQNYSKQVLIHDKVPFKDVDHANFTNVESVLLHELLHKLGVRHTNKNTVGKILMEKTYTGLTRLARDDIEALQSLYGPPIKTTKLTIDNPFELCFR